MMNIKHSNNSQGQEPVNKGTVVEFVPSNSPENEAKIKPAHLLVLQGLEIANMADNRVVTVDEIIKAFLSEEIRQLEIAYVSRELSSTVSKILDLLVARGLVFSPGKIGKSRYYGSRNVLNPENSPLPDIKSRRRRVEDLLRDTVSEFGRAVRTGDVLEYAERNSEYSDLAPHLITRDLLNLEESGDIKIVGTVRGDEKGLNLYLPSNLEADEHMPKEPLTWLDEVAQAIEEIWKDERVKATAEKRRPRPLSTGMVRARLSAKPQPHPNLGNTKLMINAMLQLSGGARPLIRKIKRPKLKGALLWAPIETQDDDLDIGDAYASDAERVGEAVRRAVENLGRPVTQRDVQDEVEMDPSLRPAGSSSLYQILSDASKVNVVGADGARTPRIIRRVYNLGKVGGATYYYHQEEGLDKALNFVQATQLKTRWVALSAEKRIQALDSCSLPSVAIGRRMLIAAELDEFLKDVDLLIEKGNNNEAICLELEGLRIKAVELSSDLHQWLSSVNTKSVGIPSQVSLGISMLGAEELLKLLKPLYPKARELDSHNQLIPLMYKSIRRVPNPAHKYRFSKDQLEAAEYLFDRTDALLFAAKEWGGFECCLQSMLAGNELDWLRDARFIFPALKAKKIQSRLAAVACLAFLQSPAGSKKLRILAVADRDPGVRKSALWAYGFGGGKDICELLQDRIENDPSEEVRKFAKGALEIKDNISWWRL